MHLPCPERYATESDKDVFNVALNSIVLSALLFLFSMVYIIYFKVSDLKCSSDPVVAAHFLVSLVVLCMTTYQLVLSGLILDHSMSCSRRGHPYIISMWYISHLSILPIYWSLYLALLSAYILTKSYLNAIVSSIFNLAYQGIFIYSVVVIYRFMKRNNIFAY